MPIYRTNKGVEIQADVSTGDQMVHTPWGMKLVRAGDVLAPFGENVVPVPGDLWRQWFTSQSPEPQVKPVEVPDKPISQMTRRELEALAQQRFGVTLSKGVRMPLLVKQVRDLVERA